MNKPESLNELIEELRQDGAVSEIEAERGAYAIVRFDDDEVRLTGAEACLLLANEDNVKEMFDALDIEDCAGYLELQGLSIPDTVMEMLLDNFQAVDEIE